MRLRIAVPEAHVSPDVLNAGLETVTRLDERMIAAGEAPPFEEAVRHGLRWRPEPPGDEHFDHAGLAGARGWGDCDDLAPWRAATLRVSGLDPDATAIVRRSGPHRWHAVVQRSDGQIEDPSRAAGMGHHVVGEDGDPALVGAGAAVYAPMFRRRRPAIAIARVPRARAIMMARRAAQDQGWGPPPPPPPQWAARADLPWADADEPYYLSATDYDEDPYEALEDAIEGVCMAGECAGVVDDEDIARLEGFGRVFRGEDPEEVAEDLRAMGIVGIAPLLMAAAPLAISAAKGLMKKKGRGRGKKQAVPAGGGGGIPGGGFGGGMGVPGGGGGPGTSYAIPSHHGGPIIVRF